MTEGALKQNYIFQSALSQRMDCLSRYMEKEICVSFANQLFYNRTSVCIFLWVLKVKGYLHMKLYEV